MTDGKSNGEGNYQSMPPPPELLHSKRNPDLTRSNSGGQSAQQSSSTPGRCGSATPRYPPSETSSYDSASNTGWSASGRGSAASGRQSALTDYTSARRPEQPFAPGLAPRKKKFDPYDTSEFIPNRDDYTLMKEKEDAELRGAWTTMDPFTKKQNYDKNWYTERSQQEDSNQSINSSLVKELPPGMPDAPITANGSQTGDPEASAPITPASPLILDDRFEDPDLDIDPAIRARFKGIDCVLEERTGPLSEFQRRNKGVLPTKAAPLSLKVVIGGRVVKTLEQKVDNRAQFQDRHGNYIGKNLGQMKKHLVEDRAVLIKLRDKEMVRATQDKREWEAMTPEERREILAKRRAQAEAFRECPGAAASDIFEYPTVPAEYMTQSDALSNSVRSTKGHSRSASVASSETIRAPTSVPSRSTPIRSSVPGGYTASTSSTRGLMASNPSLAGPRHGYQFPSGSSSPQLSLCSSSDFATDTLLSGLDPGPEIFPIQDLSIKVRVKGDETLAEQYDTMRLLSSTRGRVVIVTLHEPAKFSPATIVANIFSGIIQEIQFFPRERQAIVVFIFPSEAEAFVTHANTVKGKDENHHRRLQLEVEWYRGDEIHAVYPIQQRVFTEVLANKASRVIKVGGVAPEKKKDEVAEEMKVLLGVILVRVALIVEKRRYVRKEEGNAVTVEFASIKDAAEAMAKFQKKQIAGYEASTVSWLSDPCDKASRYGRLEGCKCINCDG